MVRLKLLHLLTNPSGWSGWPGLRCTVLRCCAGIWTKRSDKWAVRSSQILEVYLMCLTRSESPQLRLRSSRRGEEAQGIKEQCAVSDARIHWVNTSTMLAGSLTKTGYPARVVMESRSWSRNDGDAPLILLSSLEIPESKRCTCVQSRRLGRDQSINRVSGVRHSVAG